MRNTFVLTAILLLGPVCLLAQHTPQIIVSNDDMAMQLPAPAPPPEGGAGPNVLFHTQKGPGEKMTMSYFAINDSKPVTGAPYSATAVTETTQVLADGNRIVNKTESQVARDGQGRTRRQETMSNLGPLVTNAPKMVFINDPVGKANYILDLNAKTADVVKLPPPGQGPHAMAMIAPPDEAQMKANAEAHAIQKTMIVAAGAGGGMEQRVWVNGGESGEVKTETLGTQTIEGVQATGTRTTRTIPAGEIGNERPLEITSEVWTSPDLQIVVLSKRNDPRVGETIYKLTNLQRGEPDPSLFQVPSGFTTRQPGGFKTTME